MYGINLSEIKREKSQKIEKIVTEIEFKSVEFAGDAFHIVMKTVYRLVVVEKALFAKFYRFLDLKSALSYFDLTRFARK